MFKEIQASSLEFNPFTKIGTEWMLISAGNRAAHNTMTASWGALGHIWQKDSVTVYIRPQRYTKEFVDASSFFTASFFDRRYKSALAICGEKSGRDTNKEAEAGLTPYFIDETVSFAEASLIFVCRKVFHTPLPEAGFDLADPARAFYPDKDFHTMYIGEILKTLVKA